MQTHTNEAELAHFLATVQTATWNRPRSSSELANFISAHHDTLEDDDVIDGLFA